MPEAILGISAFYHDSAAALILDGEIVAAAQEERFTRKKHDSSFPIHAVSYVLREGGMTADDLTAAAFYDKPYIKFERLLETYHAFAPRGLRSFLSAMPVWIKEKLLMRQLLKRELAKLGDDCPTMLFPEHHLSHAASAFFPSPFEEAAILTIDGVGEWATTTIGHGQGNTIRILKELHFPHSVGLLYSAFTYYCGFKVNSGEYKLMGLAPYGNPEVDRTRQYRQLILDELVDLREDGSILLNMDYFNYATGLTMCRDDRWKTLFGLPPRDRESQLTQPYMDLALAIQHVTEDIVLRLATTARELSGSDLLTMAGGVALNCVANGKLLREGIFKDFWIQPAAGDAGGAVGAALAAWHIWKGQRREIPRQGDGMHGAFLGPQYGAQDVVRVAHKYGAQYVYYSDSQSLCSEVARLLSEGKVVGWFQGRMEYGPRALGNRSILGDPRHPEMQKRLNLKIKYREGFRPFAPSVLEEDARDYFELDRPSPYMLLVAPVKPERREPLPEGYSELPLLDRLYHLRSDIPAVTHIDYSARIQTVGKETNERYWQLIHTFKEQTTCPMLVNTSFNVRGEPIVCAPEDAYRCFMRTEMDYLVMENYLFEKQLQPKWKETHDWKETFELD
ncbi:MAG: carbamoyltransferase [Candidatus Abyssubacteria bacterium]|nr:carbamoyltransferase [Candidatus Abyssubacteria bacterium]